MPNLNEHEGESVERLKRALAESAPEVAILWLVLAGVGGELSGDSIRRFASILVRRLGIDESASFLDEQTQIIEEQFESLYARIISDC